METLMSLLGRNGYLPHGYCFQWTPELLWSMVGADAVIALSYFSIPLAIVSFVRRRGGAPGALGAMPWLFSAFIFACGMTHVLDIWTLWRPDYGPQAIGKLLTAGVSAATALALWPLIPRLLQIPSVDALQAAVGSLQAEVDRRRSAEEHLADTERSLALTLASIEAGFIATDLAGHVTRLNAVAERITGWTQAEALGRPALQVFRREGREPGLDDANPVQLMHERGVTMNDTHDVVALARDGRRTRVELRAGLAHDAAGAVRGMVMVFRDVTRQREAEAVVPRLAAIVESSRDAIVGKTLDGVITSWNRAAESMFGYSADEAVGRPVQMLFPPGTDRDEMALLERLARGESVEPFFAERCAKDGRRVHVLVTISPIRDARGRIVGASKILRDVGEQRRAEAALRDSQARLRFALETAGIGDWELDLATGRTRRSIRHDRCFGHDTPQPDWSFETLLAHVHADDRERVAQTFDVALRGRLDWGVECRVVWPDGSVHWIEARGSLDRDDAGSPPGRMLGIVMDITRQKQAEQARLTAQRLEAENLRIQEASRLKSQFLANMSHELRTPLNAVIGFADLLQTGTVPPDSPRHREYLGHIGNSGRHLLQLINDVLDLSKVEAGKLEFFPEPLRLAPLFEEMRALMLTALQRKRIVLQLDVGTGLDDLVLDPSRLKQVLYNYLSNAIKFTPEGGHVALRARAVGVTHLRIEVEDDGVGVAEEHLPLLFVEFQQVDGSFSKRHQGTGLGLALTRRLVRAQGGEVGVRSRLGQGSVFHLVLPRRPEWRDAALPPRLLVVTADAAQASALSEPLGRAGCLVDVAETAALARRHAQDRAYQALTLELMLPDSPGLRLLAELREQGLNPAAPVVGLSLTLPAAGQAAFAVADVLPKPLQADAVRRALAANGLRAGSGARVMVVDDDPAALDLMLAALGAAALEARGWPDGRAALDALEGFAPQAIVLDLMMPGLDGFAVLQALAGRPAARGVPVFLWTSLLLTDDELALLRRSACEVLHKGGGTLQGLVDWLRSRPALKPQSSREGS
ncbi:MAG: PAS domain S-box protein [Burkholderiaceae bacterium]|nr:PAS domain S-box protein [Burkholderiaceae bacterium]